MGLRQVNVRNFAKVGPRWDRRAGKVTLKGPTVPLTFGNETERLRNRGRSVMSCSRHIRVKTGHRFLDTSRTPSRE